MVTVDNIVRAVHVDGKLFCLNDVVAIRERPNAHHQRRLDSHGFLYRIDRFMQGGPLVEAISLATGVRVTLDCNQLERPRV